MLAEKLNSGAGGPVNYIEDVFSTYLYTGNGSTQTITNGIDLAGKGGLVWVKSRSNAVSNILVDTARGASNTLYSDATNAQTTSSSASVNAFNSNGFGVNGGSFTAVNFSGYTYASWTFRKQPKFFDVVTYTGTGANRTIAHALGSAPGCIIVKRTDTTSNWQVYHNGLSSAANSIQLNLTAAQAAAATVWNSTAPTSSVFSVGTSTDVNASGGTYVAYLFAHNAGGFGLTGTDNVISCGSYVDNTTGIINVNLGYEVQWLLCKPATSINDWFMVDTMRGDSITSAQYLYANKSNAEMGPNTGLWYPTATGFSIQGSNSGDTVIYIAIRRGPMKVPTDGTKVFYPSASPANLSKITTGFPVDLSIWNYRAGYSLNSVVNDRLRGVSSTSTSAGPNLSTSSTAAEGSTQPAAGWDNTGITAITGGAAWWLFQRAPGFFDEVCYTGTGAAATLTHNLGAVPELMLVKDRSLNQGWYVYVAPLNANSYLALNTSGAAGTSSGSGGLWQGTTPTASQFYLGSGGTPSNTSGVTYVNYLFASCPGVSKVGSYTGNGSTQTINCGFTGGARFVLIKRTDSTGDWYVYDTARGITSGNDPYLLMNSTAAEMTLTDYISPQSSGFGLTATGLATVNVSGASYIYLAIA